MKFSTLLDSITAASLEVAWLRTALRPVSDFGERAFEDIEPFAPGDESSAQEQIDRVVRQAVEYSQDQVDAMRDALRSCADPVGALARAGMGDVLEDAQFLELLRFLDGAERIEAIDLSPAARDLKSALERGRAGTFGFYLDDAFDPALARARADADRAQAAFESARGRLARRTGDALGRDDTGSGEFIVMRDSATSLPQGVRVVREAPTYFLCELELDADTLAALQRRDDASADLAAQEQRVRSVLSQQTRAALPELETLLERMAAFDVQLARVRFAQRYACVAQHVQTRAEVTFEQGAFLPLQTHLQTQGRRYEPISIELTQASVLTGPNMGGKSAALRTCGFIALLTAFGVPVPAQTARVALFDHIAWLGTNALPQDETLLSSFAGEIVRLNGLLARDARRKLILLDEFARTTTPHESAALLVALLRYLRKRDAAALAATHLSGVAERAGAIHFAVRGLRELPALGSGELTGALDALAAAMDYSVVPIGEASEGRSDAIALAQLLGLDDEIAAGAKEEAWTR